VKASKERQYTRVNKLPLQGQTYFKLVYIHCYIKLYNNDSRGFEKNVTTI